MHQKWKEEQELRRRKAKQDSSGSTADTGHTSGDEDSSDISGFIRALVTLFRYAIMATAVFMAAGQFVAGDAFWGYRGKYVKLRTYMPVSLMWDRLGGVMH